VDACPDDLLLVTKMTLGDPSRRSIIDLCSGRTLVSGTQKKEYVPDVTFSPEGQLLALRDENVHLYEAAGGQRLATLPAAHRGAIIALAFSLDGAVLATGGAEGNVVTWNCDALCKSAPQEPLSIDALWHDLRDTDAAKAHRAAVALRSVPKASIPLLGEKLEQTNWAAARRLRQLIAELDDDAFRVRQAATKELAAIGLEAVPLLRSENERSTSAESEKRLSQLLADPKLCQFSPESLRSLRAIQVLALIGNDEAKAVLRELAKGPPGMLITVESQKRLKSALR
jgi:hypothetical protein